jgi:hypothetical protein
MEPRFIMKTHTSALRPGNFSILIGKCTYPDKSAYPEAVIKRLQEWIKEKSVAKFIVLLSTAKNRGFGFLRDNMIWSWKGHVINTVLCYICKKESNNLDVFYELSLIERVCYLRYFLETEGAIILKLAERFQKKGELSYSYLKDNIQDIFKEIFEEYMDIAPDFRSRIKIREIYNSVKTKERYDESTLPHKVKPHLEMLEDLGIVKKQNNSEIYISVGEAISIIKNNLFNIQNMENLFDKYGYFPLIAQIYNLSYIAYSYEAHSDLLKEAFSYGYQIMHDRATGMADIDALIDWCCIKLLSENNILIRKEDVEDFLNKIRTYHPSKIRYHLNRKGRISYLILSEPL